MKTCEKIEKNLEFDVDKNSGFLDRMRSWNSFGIHEKILYALYDKKYFEPTKIQSRCLGPAICGQMDILGAAETGSGKTLAFGIPIVNGILSIMEKELNQSSDSEDLETDDE